MMTMMTVIDNVVDHYTYQTRWGQKRTHAKIHPENPNVQSPFLEEQCPLDPP